MYHAFNGIVKVEIYILLQICGNTQHSNTAPTQVRKIQIRATLLRLCAINFVLFKYYMLGLFFKKWDWITIKMYFVCINISKIVCACFWLTWENVSTHKSISGVRVA